MKIRSDEKQPFANFWLFLCFMSCACVAADEKMNVKYAIPENNKIEYYEKIVKELFLLELKSHGYEKGFDFTRAIIEVYESKHYAVPHYNGSVLFREDLLYIPNGVKLERFFELNLVEYEGQLEVKKREREDYYYLEPKGSYEEFKAKVDRLENKGPYPGIEYFRDELNRLDQSLRKHKPLIQRDFGFSIVLDKLPTNGYIYQLSDKEVRLHLSLDNSSVIFPGVEITYNLETGEISDLILIPPPSLM